MTENINPEFGTATVSKVLILGTCPLCGRDLKGTMQYVMDVPLETLNVKSVKRSLKLVPTEFAVHQHACEKVDPQVQVKFYVDEGQSIRYNRIRASNIDVGRLAVGEIRKRIDD